MENNNEIILRTEGVSKLYGPNRNEAVRMMMGGSDKSQVNQATGCTVALWNVNLEIPKGKIFVIIGLSGSGKSTMVRCFNCLNHPTQGKIWFEGKEISQMNQRELLEYRRNKISMVFQSFGLMSHRDVLGNVAYGLEVKGMPREERERKAKEIISMVGLDGWEHKSCEQLSGGMRQRVGIARALANDPEVLLMDEPFSALDPLVRRDMQFELLQIQQRLQKTVIFITHDIDEAFKLGDMVAIMRDGKVIQVDTPEAMSANPVDSYVREFTGSADKSKVLTVGNIMITPASMVRLTDSPDYALKAMRKNAHSTVYVVDKGLHLVGVLSVQAAVAAHKEGKTIPEVMQTEVQTTSPDMLVADIMPLAAEAPFPIAVVDDEQHLKGIVTKASVLSSLL